MSDDPLFPEDWATTAPEPGPRAQLHLVAGWGPHRTSTPRGRPETPTPSTRACRSCGGERATEDVTASGICSSCLPGPARGNLTSPGARSRLVPAPPTPITAAPSIRRREEPVGPGRQAVRAALAEFRARRDQPTIPTDPEENR
ncbi:MAG: hypothetical protein ACOC84_00730 [Actinomycetota bacterium]